MTEHNVYYYEGMFVFPQGRSGGVGPSAQLVEEMITRSGGEIIALSKWGEKHLATPIEKNKRALFILAYFKMQGNRLVNLERDCNLSEQVRRSLIIRADHLTEDEMRATDGREDLRVEANLKEESGKDKADASEEASEATASTAAQ